MKCNEIQKYVKILNDHVTKWKVKFNAVKQKLMNSKKYIPNLQQIFQI